MEKFNFFNQYSNPVIILDNEFNVVYRNNIFKRVFKDFSDAKKFSHNMNFDICPMDSGNIEIYSPIYHAVSFKENFSAYISYETNPKKYYYFNLYAVKRNKYTIIFFLDVTSEIKLDLLQNEYQKLNEEFEILKSDNNELTNIKQKAQSQAIRIALINKVSNIIRQSINISEILNSALKELSIMFGAYKAYYAEYTDKTFVIKETYGEKNEAKSIDYDEHTSEILEKDEISVSNCLIEYKNATTLKQPVMS